MKLVKTIMTAFFNHELFVVKFIRLYDPTPLFSAFKLKHDIFLGLSTCRTLSNLHSSI